MFSHLVLGTNDTAKAKTFYDAIIGATGGRPGAIDAKGRLVYFHNGGLLIVTTPLNGKPACHANGGTVGFTMASSAEADAWYAAGAAAGGTPCEDPPGLRDMGGTALYLAYLRDPDGNKLCAMHRVG